MELTQTQFLKAVWCTSTFAVCFREIVSDYSLHCHNISKLRVCKFFLLICSLCDFSARESQNHSHLVEDWTGSARGI